jgi:hypothetical protein
MIRQTSAHFLKDNDMSCCGQKRAMQKAAQAIERARRNPSTPPSFAQTPQTRKTDDAVLRYIGGGSISLCGPHTGRVYYFAAPGDALVVDCNDVDALLRTQLFEREGSQNTTFRSSPL